MPPNVPSGVSAIINKLPHFMEYEGSLPYSKEPDIEYSPVGNAATNRHLSVA
jgi:hypothetical protein